MNEYDLRRINTLIYNHRWAALATLGAAGPEASWVAFAPEPDFTGFLLHVSQLSPHTQNLLQDPRASLAISEAEGAGDPQQLARLSLHGTVAAIARGTAEFAEAGRRYRERLPASEQWFDFGDFVLLRLQPMAGRFIGGFAQACTLDAETLQAAASI